MLEKTTYALGLTKNVVSPFKLKCRVGTLEYISQFRAAV